MNKEPRHTIDLYIDRTETSLQERQPCGPRVYPLVECGDPDNLHAVIQTNYASYPNIELFVDSLEDQEIQFDLRTLGDCSNIVDLLIAPNIRLNNLEGISGLSRLRSLEFLTPLESVAGIEFCHTLANLKLCGIPPDTGLISGLGIETLDLYSDDTTRDIPPIEINLPCLKELNISTEFFRLLEGVSSPAIERLRVHPPVVNINRKDLKEIMKSIENHPSLLIYLNRVSAKRRTSRWNHTGSDRMGTESWVLAIGFF